MKRINLTTVGYADLETGKVYTRKSDRNRGIQRRTEKELRLKAEAQAEELRHSLDRLKAVGKFIIKTGKN